MARQVRNPKVDSRTARARLAIRREPYWTAIAPGRHLGYRRSGAEGGTWLAKQRDPETGARRYQALGPADDVLDAGGDILTYEKAQEAARAFFASPWRNDADAEPGSESQEAGPYTVGKAIEDYLVWLEKNRKSASAARYAAKANILPQLGTVPLAELTSKQLRKWLDGLAESPGLLRVAKGAEPKQRPALASDDDDRRRSRRATANRVYTVLRAALNQAWSNGKVDTDAAWRPVKALRRADAARMRWLTEEEIKRLLNACPIEFRALVRAALLSGCRYGELTKLTCADYDPDAGSLHIRDSKSGKPRWVPLDDDGREFFGATIAGRPGKTVMLPKANGKAWGKSHQKKPLIDASAAAKLDPPANFHCLRHSWASHRIMQGAPLLVVAQVLGHADTRMVEKHYGHLAPSYVRDMIRSTPLGIGSGVETSNVVSITEAA